MSTNRHARAKAGITAITAILALLLAGCSSKHPSAPAPSASGAVHLGRQSGAQLTLPGGAGVTAPPHTIVGSGTLTGHTVTPPKPAPTGLNFDGSTYQFEVTGAHIVGNVSISLPAPAPTSGPDTALLTYYNPTTRAWTPVAATYHPDTHTLTANTAHLSIWAVLRIDPAATLTAMKNLLLHRIGIAAVPNPTCPGNDQLTGLGVKVTSDSGNIVRWCAGTADGHPLLRITNNRRGYLAMTYPNSWTAHRTTGIDLVTDEIITSGAGLLTAVPSGRRGVILPGGGTVELDAPAGSSGLAEIRPDAAGFLLSGVAFGIDTIETIFAKIPGMPAPSETRTAKAVSLVFTMKDCASSFDDLAHTDVTTATGALSVFKKTADYAFGCLHDAWEIAYKAPGLLTAFLGTLYLWILKAGDTLIDGITGTVDAVVYWRTYRIALQSALSAPPCVTGAQLIAAWRAHSGYTATYPSDIHCAGPWAVGFAVYGGNEFTVVLHWSNGSWAVIDRQQPCATRQIPAGIYDKACMTN